MLADLVALESLTATVHEKSIKPLVTAEKVFDASEVTPRSIGGRVSLCNAPRCVFECEARISLI